MPAIAPVKPSLQEHQNYLEKIIRLKLFYVHHRLKQHPEESFQFVMRNRVDIYRKTDLNTIAGLCPDVDFQNPRWLAMEQKAKQLYDDLKDQPEAFEEQAFQTFRQSVMNRSPLDYEVVWKPIDSPCGSIQPEKSLQPDGKSLAIHIANALAPVSFFSKPAYLTQCVEKLIDFAEHLGAKDIICSSWLNSVPAWQELFPTEWTSNASPPETDVQWHYGFWGQFISARKTFNDKYGRYFREHGDFPFPLRHCRCSLESLIRHQKTRTH